MEDEKYEKLTCEICKEEFIALNTEEEAFAEAPGLKDVPREEISIVCDDCYQIVMNDVFGKNIWHNTG